MVDVSKNNLENECETINHPVYYSKMGNSYERHRVGKIIFRDNGFSDAMAFCIDVHLDTSYLFEYIFEFRNEFTGTSDIVDYLWSCIVSICSLD